MSTSLRSHRRARLAGRSSALAAVLAGLVAGCGGGGSATTPPSDTEAARSHIVIDAPVEGATPFIALVTLHGSGTDEVQQLDYTIAALPGATAAPVSVSAGRSWLERIGRTTSGSTTMTLPVIGLPASSDNAVHLVLTFADGSTLAHDLVVTTGAWTTSDGVHDQPSILVPHAAGAGSIDYFWLKNTLGSPIVIDSDGRVRWVTNGVGGTFSSDFTGDGFIVGGAQDLQIQRVELDGTSTLPATLAFPGGIDFSHNLQPGEAGELGEVDATIGGQTWLRSIALQFDPATGALLDTWNLGDILSNWMRAHGDDPTLFVRPDVDWFHMNTVIADPSDHTIIVSSRENFVLKFDPVSGDIRWILGDPTKYWHTFASLRAKALAIVGAGSLVPIGQHDVNFAPDGHLMFFNDGANSFNQPAGQPAGAKRSYSAVSSYVIDEAGGTATEAWHIDDGQAIFSRLCGSARQAADGSVLADFPDVDDGTHARVVAFDAAHRVAFDFQYANPSGCDTGWNAQIFPFTHLELR